MKNSEAPTRVAAFASGRGSNFEAILAKIQSGDLDAKFCVVITNNPNAGIIATAEKNKIPVRIISGDEPDTELISLLEEFKTEFIVLAGYLKKIGNGVIDHFPNRILNIHPGKLPDFGGKGKYGIHVHEAVIAAGARTSAATVHFVDSEYDHGKKILQADVDVANDDDAYSLQKKVLEKEHEIFWQALKKVIEEKKGVSSR